MTQPNPDLPIEDEPVEQTDNTERPEDGKQDVSQSPTFDYSEGPEVTE